MYLREGSHIQPYVIFNFRSVETNLETHLSLCCDFDFARFQFLIFLRDRKDKEKWKSVSGWILYHFPFFHLTVISRLCTETSYLFMSMFRIVFWCRMLLCFSNKNGRWKMELKVCVWNWKGTSGIISFIIS